MGITGIFGNISQTKKRSNAKKLSFKLMSALLGCTLFLSPIKVSAQGIQTRSMDNQVNYTLAGETDGVLDYARTDFTKEDSNGIHLTVTKWAKLPGSWGGTDKGPYNGRFLLNFFNDEFYTQIESITVNGVQFEKEADGALWKVPINNQTLQSGLIGVITNTDVVIKLKNGKTLDSLGLASKKIDFTTVWVRSDGMADKGGYDNGFILKNNPNVPALPTNSSSGNENYLGTGMNSLEHDGTKSKDGNFSGGHTGKIVSYDAQTKTIKSTVSFKPDQNFLQANSGWVLYINEVIPQELLQYIDTDNVTLGVSTPTGNITASNPIKLVVDPNGNGVISTKDTPELSIVGGDWNKVTQVRSTLDSQVFYGALGQRRSYTIEYKLKSNVTNQQFAEALNNYINTNGQQLNFESWLTADFVDSTNVVKGIRKPDGGKPNKIIQNTYSTAFLQVLDTDKDGLYDFVEDEIGTDKFNVDTDGDGVPDGQEYLTDHTDPKDAKSYLVVKPNVTTTNIEANSPQQIIGTVPKTIHPNPADTSTNLTATNTDAGNVIVKAYKYVADDTDYTTQPVKAQTTIPYSDLTDGNFTVNVPAGTFNDGDKVILVAYSPDGNNPMVSDTKVNVGAIKVTFDTNGGKWSDGTDTDKVVNAVGGTATQPEEPTRDGYQFLGWASSASATAAEANILTNITAAKEVFAVWKDVKAPEITTISDQTVVEGNPISEITVTTDDPNATVTVSNLPNGVTYDPTTKKISGTPTVTDWTSTEETREFTVTVEAKDEAGNISTKTFKITVQRDTDRDGTPDVTDTDDDGDGYPDTEEAARGTDPKDSSSKPSTTITPISNQTVIEGNPISPITVTVDNPNTTITVKDLPDGVTYNPTTKTITGTPAISDWGAMEEHREITVTVEAKDSAGNITTETFKITVQRDTDGDGDPDVTDPDDDNDGYSDIEESAKRTNPKDPNSKPSTTINPINDQTVVEGNPINEITVVTDNPTATITVKDLPNGVTYDPTTKKISGTPTITDWAPTEETRVVTVTVEAKDSAGNTTTKTFKITVQRDTDRDGNPDITDLDDDGDGVADTDEQTAGSNPKDSNSRPAVIITPVPQPTISNPTQTVVDKKPITSVVINPGNPASAVTVDTTKLPNGVTYDPTTKTISGTPNVTDWGTTEESRKFEIPVVVTNPDGSKVTKIVEITVQRDTDGDGDPDVTDPDDDNDGYTDVEETAKGTDPKDPTSKPTTPPTPQPIITNPTQTVIDEKPISNIVITPGDPASTVTVDTTKLPNGVTYDPATKTISGTPDVTDWGTTEETRKFEIPVVVTNPDGTTVTKKIEITVQRDTDGDGNPDVTDPDDDNDGYTDVEENAKGSDPKNSNSRPAEIITPVEPVSISNQTQTVIDKTPISPILIGTGNIDSTVTVDTTKLPNGVTYDPNAFTISGTPTVTDWGTTEETRKFEIPVVVTNPDGSKVTKIVEITVQRDTDGDGTPDVTDTDDDGDGYPDTEETARGTDPKDPTSKPTTSITPISDQTVVEGNPINEITVVTDNPTATVTVSNLPNGVTYDPTTKKITGTPAITDWTPTEETREITVTVTATDTAGNTTTSTFKITVQRDTDGDGDPDVTDPDDDNDGYTDVEETAKGTDPKDPTSKPTTPPTPQPIITNPTQTVIDEKPISNIVITPGDPASTVTVDTTKLPNGVTYDPATKTISGTPDVTDWGTTEETRKFEIPVVVTNPDGTTVTKKIEITVQRDTDGDGNPDVTDPDDDNDGYTDVEENAKGSDPKNSNSRPAEIITPVEPVSISNQTQTVIDKTPISPILIGTGNIDSTVTVDTTKLPNGVTYDPNAFTISGTPTVTDWGTTEETRKFEIPVVVTNPDGSKVTKIVEITVQRDTDGDGTPDVTDTDDDGDGYPDTEETARGTDPKDPTSKPTITPVPTPQPSTPSTSGSSSTVQKTPQTSDATNLFGHAASMTFFGTLLLVLAFIRRREHAAK